MALLFADGFEDGSAGWSLSNAALGTGRFGSGLVLSNSIGSGSVGFPPTVGLMIVGCAFKPVGTAQTGVCALFGPGSWDNHVFLNRGISGEIQAFRGSSSTATFIASSAIGVLPAGAWSYIEIKLLIHNTAGVLVVRVNGVEVLNLTNIDTKDESGNPTGTVGQFILGHNFSGVDVVNGNAYDDVYICDATGTYNNDFLGELSVEHLRPASDDTAQFLGSDGNSVNNWDLVDEAGTYNGSDYVASSTIGQRDLYVPIASTRPITSSVFGVIVSAVAMKTDAGTRTSKMCVKEGVGGSVRQSAELGLPTSFGEVQAVFERKGDNAQFTIADVNALRFGMEVTA